MNSFSLPTGKFRGLGDVVYVVAHPIAVAIDAATKAAGHPTNVKNCGGCQKRRENLNQAVPFTKEK